MPGRLGSISGNSSRLAILILLTSLVTEVLRKMGSLPLGVFLVPIPASDWTYPADFMDSSLWHGLEWNADYRMMGDWRLTHQMQ
ncbi:MAG: hypothetical protein WDW36_007386 [Sanguina aurantia]